MEVALCCVVSMYILSQLLRAYSVAVMVYEGVKLVCDPKSLLYLFGMELDYSDALVRH